MRTFLLLSFNASLKIGRQCSFSPNRDKETADSKATLPTTSFNAFIKAGVASCERIIPRDLAH